MNALIQRLVLLITPLLFLIFISCNDDDHQENHDKDGPNKEDPDKNAPEKKILTSKELLEVVDFDGSEKTINIDKIKENENDEIFFGGIVNSNNLSGNSPLDLIIIQNVNIKDGQGIALKFDDDPELYIGDSLKIDIDKAKLKLTESKLIKLSDFDIKSISEDNKIEIPVLEVKDLNKNFNKYIGSIVQLNNLKFLDNSKNIFNGEIKMTDKSEDTITVYTKESADFSKESIKNKEVNQITGLIVRNNKKNTLMMRDLEDISFSKKGELYSNFPESFESESLKGDPSPKYDDLTPVEFATGEWIFDGGRDLSSGGFISSDGGRAIMMKQNDFEDEDEQLKIEMNFDLKDGVSKISFIYGYATSGDFEDGSINQDKDAKVGFYVEYSQDEGNSWKDIGHVDFDPEIGEAQTAEFKDLQIKGKFRIRIIKKGIDARITIDKIAINDYK